MPNDQPHHSLSRPNSRLSAPEPIPLPFQRSILSKQQLYSGGQKFNSPPGSGTASPSRSKSPLGYIEPIRSPRRDGSPVSARGSKRRSGSSLKPVMRKSFSGSVDAHLDMQPNQSVWRGRNQVAPFHRRVTIDMPPIGWSVQPQFGSNSRMSKQTPADIASLMVSPVSPTGGNRNELTLSHGELQMIGSGGGGGGESDGGHKSTNSIELQHDLFSNPRNSVHQIETVTEGIQIDMFPHDENKLQSQKWRSASAKYGSARQMSGSVGQKSEFTASAKHLSDRSMSATFAGAPPLPPTHRRELPSLEHRAGGSVKVTYCVPIINDVIVYSSKLVYQSFVVTHY